MAALQRKKPNNSVLFVCSMYLECLRITHPLQAEFFFYVRFRCFPPHPIVERASSRCSGTRDDGDVVISGRMKVVKITNIINSENLLLLSAV